MLALWILTFILLIASLLTGYQALFTNWGNAHWGWFLGFWASMSVMAVISNLMVAKLFKVKVLNTAIGTLVLTGIVFLFSNPIGLLVFFAIPLLALFYLFVVISIILIPTLSLYRRHSD